ncbi:MAG: enoyl-CoA hydratase [Actinomycetota bacterium]|nr:MAG: enoyl-CoA hydratase [Actinomycetota bacterium]
MPVTTRRQDAVLIVGLDREAKRNAIDGEMALGIDAALAELEADAALRVGVITGTPRVFSAGTDLTATASPATEDGGEYGVIRRPRTKPLIAAVEGPALGGGFEIALACDLVVASQTATFGLPEARRGVIPTSGALFRALRALPPNVARWLMLTGGTIDATQAYEFGFVNQVVAPGRAVAAALDAAALVMASAPTSVAQILVALREIAEPDDARGWAATERAAEVIRQSEDFREGVRAFFERREPTWPGGGAMQRPADRTALEDNR